MNNAEIYRENDDPAIRLVGNFTDLNAPIKPNSIGYGCRYSCVYCNQQAMDKSIEGQSNAGAIYPAVDGGVSINPELFFNRFKVKEYNEDQLLGDLKNYPYWNKQDPVILYNFSDPSLNWPKAINLADRLVQEVGQQGPIQFITKGAISQKSVKSLVNLQQRGGHPIVIVTYSGMPESVEPIPASTRIKTMGKLRAAGIPVIMSMRPIVMGINGELNQVQQVLQEVGDLPTIITVGGLYVYPSLTINAFAKAGFQLQEPYTSWKYPIRKILPSGYRDSIRWLAKSIGDQAPVYNHTSCATSTIMTTVYNTPTPDSFAHWAGEEKDGFDYCQTYCHAEQIPNCQQLHTFNDQKINDAEAMLRSMGYNNEVTYSKRLVGTLLVVDGSLPVAELYPLVRKTGLKVFNLPSEAGVFYRTNQALQNDLSDNSSHIIKAMRAGQEWFILLNHYPQNDKELTQLYVRSRNQARITAYSQQEIDELTSRAKITTHILSVCDDECSLGDIDRFVQPNT